MKIQSIKRGWFFVLIPIVVLLMMAASGNDVKPLPSAVKDIPGHAFFMTGGDLPNGISDMFIGSGKCAGCHGLDLDSTNMPLANLNALGYNVSPAENWRATMMANSAKDPMWQAKVAHETSVNPAHANELVNKCTSCHAPLGRFEAQHDGIENYTMTMLNSDSLARDGVSCMACHAQQIETTGLHFSGELEYNADTIWGPLFNIGKSDMPMADYIMANFVGVAPVATHKFSQSEVCAGCHSLVTHTADLQGNATGDNFIEQATYHEWLNSIYSIEDDNNQECQGCHMPRLDESVVIASGYDFLPGRNPFSQHWLVGGNTFMLELMKNRIDQLGITANENHFDTVITRTLQNLQQHSATIEINQGNIDADTARYTVKLTNKAGHKLPSGYPARRAFVEFIAMDDNGNEIFHSGAVNSQYEVVGQNADWEPHYDVITNGQEQVQIYEMVLGDVNGNVTTVLERAHHSLKDNRLVPAGFSTQHAVYDTTAIVGVDGDNDFNRANGIEGSGSDEISYHIPLNGYSGNINVIARFMYQSLPPKWNAEMFATSNSVIDQFEEMYWAEGPDPVEMVSSTLTSVAVALEPNIHPYLLAPNPTSDGKIVVSAGTEKIKSISIYDAKGNLIGTYSTPSSHQEILLPASSGMYLIQINSDRKKYLEKVIRR